MIGIPASKAEHTEDQDRIFETENNTLLRILAVIAKNISLMELKPIRRRKALFRLVKQQEEKHEAEK